MREGEERSRKGWKCRLCAVPVVLDKNDCASLFRYFRSPLRVVLRLTGLVQGVCCYATVNSQTRDAC